MAVSAATIAGLPNPCDMSEKCVRGRCMIGSRICWGLVLHSGDRSWFSRSISSLVTCLRIQNEHSVIFINARMHRVILIYLESNRDDSIRRFYTEPSWKNICRCTDSLKFSKIIIPLRDARENTTTHIEPVAGGQRIKIWSTRRILWEWLPTNLLTVRVKCTIYIYYLRWF